MATIAPHLSQALSRFSQKALDSVQSGQGLKDFDQYMHVKRPIEGRIKQKMLEIDNAGGGILLLVGSAGDGKSHIISTLKEPSNWPKSSYYNDATESSSPYKNAITTLKESLVDFADENIDETSSKLLLAINLGKLNGLIEDDEFKLKYKNIAKAVEALFDDNESTHPQETSRIKIVLFTDDQNFEIYPQDNTEYPVNSDFFSGIIDRIVSDNPQNIIHQEYLKDKALPLQKDPLLLNYELLKIEDIKESIVKLVIEAIVRFGLRITPREFLDFIYTILVPTKDNYKEKSDFYSCLLPYLLFEKESDNQIQKAIRKLDPLKNSNRNHDYTLSQLFSSYCIPKDILAAYGFDKMPTPLITRVNQFFDNNGNDIEESSKFVIRMMHLTKYHSDSETYISFLNTLKNILIGDEETMEKMYDLVLRCIPRHYGSYFYKDQMLPSDLQGGKYRFYVSLPPEFDPIASEFRPERPNVFPLSFNLTFLIDSEKIHLLIDYPLFSYLMSLNRGRLASTYENDRNLSFGLFLRKLSKTCNQKGNLTIVSSDSEELTIKKSLGKPILTI